MSKARSNLVPDDVGLRIAVQQQERRAVAAQAQIDLRLGGRQPPGFETVEHV